MIYLAIFSISSCRKASPKYQRNCLSINNLLLRRLRQHVIPLVFQLPSSKLVCNAEDIHPESFIPCNTLQSTLDQHGRGFGCLRVDGLINLAVKFIVVEQLLAIGRIGKLFAFNRKWIDAFGVNAK